MTVDLDHATCEHCRTQYAWDWCHDTFPEASSQELVDSTTCTTFEVFRCCCGAVLAITVHDERGASVLQAAYEEQDHAH